MPLIFFFFNSSVALFLFMLLQSYGTRCCYQSDSVAALLLLRNISFQESVQYSFIMPSLM